MFHRENSRIVWSRDRRIGREIERNTIRDVNASQSLRPRLSASATAAVDVVAMAASAGGLKALESVVGALPRGFPAAVLVVLHVDPKYPSHVAEILDRHADVPVHQAKEGESLYGGRVYVAPPDRHLIVTSKRFVSLSKGELVQYVRPSADVLFESVAAAFGAHAIAVVLTGTGKDGAAGVREIKRRGGTVVVQDPATSEYSGMPGSAIQTGCVDFELPLAEIAGMLVVLLAGERSDV